MFIDVSLLLVPPLCCFSLSIVLQTTRKGKSRNGFEKTLWFGINFWKDLHGHQGLSLSSLSRFSLSSCQKVVSIASVVWHTKKWCIRGASLLPCLHMGEALWNRKLSCAFLGPKLVPKSWAVVPDPCKKVAFRNGLGFTCAFFWFRHRIEHYF